MTTQTAEINEKQKMQETKTVSAVTGTPMSSAGANGENGSAKVVLGRNGDQNHIATVASLIRANGSRPSIAIPSMIIKRDGRIVPFDIGRIESALTRCFNSLNRTPSVPVEELAQQVVNIIAAKHPAPSVEDVQDIVEMVLQAAGEYEAAKHYILYRAEHAKLRVARPIPDEVREAFQASDRHFPTQLQKFQFYDKYSRFSYEAGRRETWIETVDRSIAYLVELSQQRLPTETYERLRRGILEMSAMPSMRLLAMAGPAARRNNITIYNCSYQPVESIDSFVEALIISMSGCGVGYSVEHRYVENFPRIRRQTGATALPYTVEDSAEGWADALRTGLATWFEGGDLRFDLSQLRPAGAPLRTKGGRASGPEPLRRMLEFTRGRILARQGNFLRPLDAHDIMCAVGGAAVSGGMRRTAMISLFDLDDEEMLQCKNGDFERNNSQRWNANNSAVWPDRELTQLEIARFMLDMIESGRGEPGIFSRRAANALRPERRAASDFGTNPCGEINLRPWEFCNLTAAVARANDTPETLRSKVELATIIGTIQSMATHFPGLRPMWRQNCEEERLLGVDITGQMDCPVIQDPRIMAQLKHHAVQVNRQVSELLGINPSVSITCVKPSGNTSQLVDCASGLHARWAPYYVRNVRVSAHSPVFKVLRDTGVPMDPENGQTPKDADTWVVHFPVKSPDGAITRQNRSALAQCEYWLQNKLYYTEHNPSITVTYHDDEVLELVKWVWEHQDVIGGMAFLPSYDAQYDQMPYEEISPEAYERLAASFPDIDFSKLFRYEEEDLTTAAQELACMAGACEVAL
jgi:ribonucleoside-diphosphate reductase alpha chain